MRYMLLPVTAGPAVLVDRALVVIGRHPQCDVRIESRRVSRLHCCLANLGHEGLLVRDLGSTNGTFVNGERVREARLKPGDRLRIAEIEYNLVSSTPEEGQGRAAAVEVPTPSQIELPSDVPLPADEDSEEVRLEFGAERSEEPIFGDSESSDRS